MNKKDSPQATGNKRLETLLVNGHGSRFLDKTITKSSTDMTPVSLPLKDMWRSARD